MLKAPPAAMIAYWLLPAASTRDFFASLIAELAARFDAPLFEPHVTIYGTSPGGESAEKILEHAAANLEPIQLSVSGVRWSEKFTKTVFVQLEANAALSALSKALRGASARRDDYELNPHLSLIYKTMPDSEKEAVASSLTLPFSKMVFDAVKAILCPTPITTRASVEAWRPLAERRLRAAN